ELIEAMKIVLINNAEKALMTPTVVHELEGPRLLTQSRNAIRIISNCALAWKITGKSEYRDRAIKCLENISRFKDWNPSHFLDVAEMSLAAGIGYDWLYDELSVSQKKMVASALVKNGLKPGLRGFTRGAWWTQGGNNWTQVCAAGLTAGAIAIRDAEPELSKKIISYSIESLPRILHVYEPDGAYPEGAIYWDYGTSFHALMVMALDIALPDIANKVKSTIISDNFLKSTEYLRWTIGASGDYFNYGDTTEGFDVAELGAAFPILVAESGDKGSALWYRKKFLEKEVQDLTVFKRLFPICLLAVDRSRELFSDDSLQQLPDSSFKFYDGEQPLAFYRNDNGFYFAIKGGKNNGSHSQMDCGSFILEKDKIRWFVDLGRDDYNLPGYWEMSQAGRRWNYFRLNNLSHNTISIGNRLHNADAGAKITRTKATDNGCEIVVDLSQTLAPTCKTATRSVGVEGARVIITDTIYDADSFIVWSATTTATIVIEGKTAILHQDGRQLTCKIISPPQAEWSTRAATGTSPLDAPNPGVKQLQIKLPQGDAEIVVEMF
ncbi:MAG: heparinase II/III family protein, partial [Spirochaetales bacterium]|nr:heparinase II/III family protein [Spirochaetales bacterium]